MRFPHAQRSDFETAEEMRDREREITELAESEMDDDEMDF
jgi:hypothetical protein